VPKADVPKKFDDTNFKVAVEIEHPIKTITHVTNLRQDSAGEVDYSIKRSKSTKKRKLPKISLTVIKLHKYPKRY